MKALLGLILILLSYSSFSQHLGNEWINYSQSYYKFPVTEEGLYRIDYSVLLQAGVPLNSIVSQNIQLFGKGEEIAIYVKDGGDNRLDNGDYLEFYAEGNSGWLDTLLYGSISKQPNPFYSLVNDTIYYFLSWNSSTSNKRISESNDIDFGNYFASNFVWKEVVQTFNQNYYDGEIFPGGATSPKYTEVEGWQSSPLGLGRTFNYPFSTPSLYSSGPLSEIDFTITGQSNSPKVNDGDHHFIVSFRGFQVDSTFEAYEKIDVKRSFSSSELNPISNTLSFSSINDRNQTVGRMAMAYFKIVYPHILSFRNLSSLEFLVDDNPTQNFQYLEITSFNGGAEPVFYDISNNKRIKVIRTLNSYKALVPNGGGRKKCVISTDNNINQIQEILPVGINGRFIDYSQLPNDSCFIIVTNEDLYQSATSYAAYRRSRNFEVLLVKVEELYDQYAYGIKKHPVSISGLIQDGLDNWSFPPTHLLLLGKSVSAKSHRKNNLAYENNLVPTIGNPATDNLLINGSGLETLIPLGRVSVKTPTELLDYLNKLSEYENSPNAKWKKEALHFAGGKSVSEANIYENYLNSYSTNFQGSKYGGNARLFRKNSSAPIQTTLSDSIRTLINSGVSLMTFFGHASANDGFDISIDTPDKLQNRGKYPLMLANSCFTGNYHQPFNESTGEDYVLEKNKGAIAYIATGNLGYAFYLNSYSSAFYRNLTKEFYGKSIAEVMRQTAIDLNPQSSNSNIERVALEMSLQGDPAIVLNPLDKPDLSITTESVKINPQEVTTELDSFQLKIVIENLGQAVEDSFIVTIRREFPTSSTKADTIVVRELKNIYYEKELILSFEIDQLTDIGVNRFTVNLDPFNSMDELSEINNQLSVDVLVRSGEIIPVYPFEYALVGHKNIDLFASTAYAFEEEKEYVFEIDTTKSFNNPIKETTTINSRGGILKWSPTVLNNILDSSVFYWRVSEKPMPGEINNWKTSSFKYIPNEYGWAQDHFDQFDDNSFLFLRLNKQSKKFEFTPNVKELYVFTKGSPSSSEAFSIRYSIDADVRERNACGGSPGFLIAVLDSLSLESWETPYNGQNPNNYFGQANFDAYCGGNRLRTEKYFLFRQNDTAQMRSMRDFLNNEVPSGNYVVIYSWQNIDYSVIWDQDSSILRSISNLGSNLINVISDDEPFIFYCKKGDISSADEVKGDSSSAEIELSKVITTNGNFGEMRSNSLLKDNGKIRLSYRVVKKENSDKVLVRMEAARVNSSVKSLLLSNKFRLDTTLNVVDSINDFNRYNLNFNTEDQLNQTVPQLKYWQIVGEELPEFAWSPNRIFSVNRDTLNQGEIFKVAISVDNPTWVNSDSLLIKYEIFSNSQKRRTKLLRFSPILKDSFMLVEFEIPTIDLVGKNQLTLELNPNQDQEEQYSYNNIAEYFFFVKADRENPLLDVTFDGRRIINRELVSAKPNILIQLTDENEYLALDDTSLIAIYLKQPNGQEDLINFNSASNLQFIAASLPNNKANIRYQPELQEDGIYKLRIRAGDKSGNSSGSQDYEIEFEVVNRSTVTKLLNYPNPFSTSTRFVFTLTGSKIPNQIQIQIMTVTGKVVREINELELGPIRIGNNITEYAWDGKDEFGDQLANGVYLYRVRMKIDGNNIENRNSNADKFFKKEFGKMYLLR